MNIIESENSYIASSTSFLVKIQYRQNTSWQGTIQWLEGKKSKHFRSFLEMMMLIHGALTASEADGDKIEFHSWNEKEDAS
jgi:hypothetical protein